MKTLLTSIQTLLKAELTYVKTVDIVPDFLVFSEAAPFPMICLLDNGDDVSGKEKGAGLYRLKVSIGIYQAIASADDASVIGSGSEKGLLDIAADVWNELKNVDFSGAYIVPVYIRSSKTQAIERENYAGFVAFKSIDLEYTKEVAEET
jgi:hypothetical protein